MHVRTLNSPLGRGNLVLKLKIFSASQQMIPTVTRLGKVTLRICSFRMTLYIVYMCVPGAKSAGAQAKEHGANEFAE